MPAKPKKKTAVRKKAATRSPSSAKRAAAKPAKKTSKRAPSRAAASAWTPSMLMAELKRLGTAQNRKVYARHGAPDSMFGVSFANLYALQKQIKRDHDLARALWETGNPDAQVLGALIADPECATRAELESWAKSAAWFMGVDYCATFVARTPHATPLATKWMKSKNELLKRAGYSTLNTLLKNGAHDGEPLDTAFLTGTLATIERDIHAAPNRAREAMNTTVICVGVYHDPLHKDAVAAAKRIGPVEIDHGEGTNCKDFIAVDEIAKARAHRAKKAKAKKKTAR